MIHHGMLNLNILLILIFQFQIIYIETTASLIINLLTECDTTNMCYKYPAECSDDTNCMFVFQWSDNGDTNSFKLAGKINTFTNRYLSIGFSLDNLMGNDTVVVCATTGVVQHLYTTTRTSPTFLNATDISLGLTEVNITQVDSWLVCEFKRQKSNNVLERYYNLNSTFHVLAAYGNFNASTNRIRKHEFKTASSRLYNFTQSSASSVSASVSPILTLLSTCDTTNMCYKYPAECSDDTNCTFVFQWSDNGDTNSFKLAGKINTFTNRYLSIGFSLDNLMGNDTVVVCATTGVVQHLYTTTRTSPTFLNATDISLGLTEVNITQVDSWLVCEFKRQKSNNVLERYYNLNSTFHVLAAYGNFNASTNRIRKHEFKTASSRLYNFTESLSAATTVLSVTSTTTTKPALADTIVEVQSTCGIEYGCFLSPSNCKDVGCTFIYKWANNGDKTDFVVSGKISSFTNRFLAIGFSKDDKMGDDSIVICRTTGEIETFYNPYDSPELIDPSNPSLGLSNTKIITDGDWMICEFTRDNQYSLGGSRKRRDAASQYFDINQQFYILGAFGNFDPSDGSLAKHEQKVPSSKAANFKTLEVIGGSVDYSKYKAHGTLMVVAWVLFASTGIIIARYYKDLFAGKKFFGVQFWFTVHFPVMIMVPVISIIAFLVILSQLNWKWISSKNTTAFIHSIFGIIAISFSVVQPILGFLRCDKDHPKRFIFNWVHRIIGLSTLTCAIVALYLGVCLSLLGLDDNGWGILLGWTVWLLILVIALESIILKYDKNPPEVTNKNFVKSPSGKSTKLKAVMLVLHLTVTIGFTIALLVIIGIADPSKTLS